MVAPWDSARSDCARTPLERLLLLAPALPLLFLKALLHLYPHGSNVPR